MLFSNGMVVVGLKMHHLLHISYEITLYSCGMASGCIEWAKGGGHSSQKFMWTAAALV